MVLLEEVTTDVTTAAACCEIPGKNKGSGLNRRKLGLEETTWTYRFKFQGKRYTLVKRNKSRDGAWWIETVIRGKRIVRSLDTNIAAAAEQRAVAKFIEPAKAGLWSSVASGKLRNNFSNIGQLLRTYEELCVGKVAPSTVRNNVNSFRLVVRRGLGQDSLPEETLAAMPSSLLTGKLVADFEEWMAKKAAIEGRDLESNKRSVQGYLRHARSLFKASALPRYGEKGVKLPDVTEFMKRGVERGAKLMKMPPSDALLEKTFFAATNLRAADRPAYIAWLLGLCSLRRGEIASMRWDWLVQHNGRNCILVPRADAKSDSSRMIPLDERVALELV